MNARLPAGLNNVNKQSVCQLVGPLAEEGRQ